MVPHIDNGVETFSKWAQSVAGRGASWLAVGRETLVENETEEVCGSCGENDIDCECLRSHCCDAAPNPWVRVKEVAGIQTGLCSQCCGYCTFPERDEPMEFCERCEREITDDNEWAIDGEMCEACYESGIDRAHDMMSD